MARDSGAVIVCVPSGGKATHEDVKLHADGSSWTIMFSQASDMLLRSNKESRPREISWEEGE
jgi:hypothetical protein